MNMETLNTILQAVGALVAVGGGLATIVYIIFKHLAASWLEAKFKERLQDLQHKQQQEIEGLKFKISALLDRAVKLHQREFEVLPEAWKLLSEAFWFARFTVHPFQQFADISQLSNTDLAEFLSDEDLSQLQKKIIMDSTNKSEVYQRMVINRRISAANEKARDALRHFSANGIFIQPDLQQKFSTIHQMIFDALSEQETCERNERLKIFPLIREKIDVLLKADAQIESLQSDIHRRLWPADEAPVKSAQVAKN